MIDRPVESPPYGGKKSIGASVSTRMVWVPAALIGPLIVPASAAIPPFIPLEWIFLINIHRAAGIAVRRLSGGAGAKRPTVRSGRAPVWLGWAAGTRIGGYLLGINFSTSA